MKKKKVKQATGSRGKSHVLNLATGELRPVDDATVQGLREAFMLLCKPRASEGKSEPGGCVDEPKQ